MKINRIAKALWILVVSILLKIVLFIPRLIAWICKTISTAFKIISETLNFFIKQVETEVLK